MEKKFSIIIIVISFGIMIFSGVEIYKRINLHLYGDNLDIIESEKKQKNEKSELSNTQLPQSYETSKEEDSKLEISTTTLQQKETAPKNYRVTISYTSKKAKNVKLNGSFYGWKERDMKKENNVWKTELILKEPGVYKYYFIVDGKKILDPKAQKTADKNYSIIEIK